MCNDYKKNIEYILRFEIPYWFHKRLGVSLYIRYAYGKELVLTLTKLRRLVDILGHEDEWGTNWWEHYSLYKFKRK